MSEPADFSHLYLDDIRKFYFCKDLDNSDSSKPNLEKEIVQCDFDEANLISSLCDNGLHKPVLDLDFSCELIPSSTSGNFHLYINRFVEPDKYEKLLLVMLECGLLQKGFVDSSIKMGASFVRPPWIKKPVLKDS